MVENTSKRDQLTHIVGAMSQGSEGYIEGMEAQGQKQVVADSEVMPADGSWEMLRVFGFGEPVPIEGDDMFVRTTLPEDWSKQSTNHSMWSEVIDERGLRRVAVFYKAAFYDRSAHFQVINVGGDLARGIIYGDDVVRMPDEWNVLTDVERTEFGQAVANFIQRAQEHPATYSDQVGRAEKLESMLEELDGSGDEDGEC